MIQLQQDRNNLCYRDVLYFEILSVNLTLSTGIFCETSGVQKLSVSYNTMFCKPTTSINYIKTEALLYRNNGVI